jgi:hypothetical protein
MLKNLVKNIFVAIVSLMAAAPAAAQSETVTISEEERALALSSYTNGECYEAFTSEDGVLTWEGHGGLYLLVAGVGEFHSFSNNDNVTDTGAKKCFGGDLGLGYRLVRTGWTLAGFGEVYGGYNSSYHVENRVVGGHMHFGALAGIENSHGAVKVGAGIKYLYDNTVSENENMQPWRGNKHRLEPFVRLSTKIFSISGHKTAHVGNKNILVKGLREVHLFAEGSYNLTNKIDKSWDAADAALKGNPYQKDNCFTVRIGLKFNIR